MTVLRHIFATAYADTARADEVVGASGLDWTIARLNRLTNGPSVGRPHVSTAQLAKPTGLTRADAAELLVDLVEDPRRVGSALNVRGR